jgi:hypothetical protein
MRPTYETDADRAAIGTITMRLQRIYGGKFSAVSDGLNRKRFRTDGQLEDCWVVKRRRYTYDQLDKLGGYMLALKKWKAGYRCSESYNCQFTVALELEDGLYTATFFWSEMEQEQVTYKEGGRIDRDDPEDVEECVYIPMWRFQKETKDAPDVSDTG